VLALAINQVYSLGLASNCVSFVSVVSEKSKKMGETEEGVQCNLQSKYPDDELTKVLNRGRAEWISELEKWRHSIAHHCCVEPVELIGEALLFIKPVDSKQLFLNNDDLKDAANLVGEWIDKTNALLKASFQCMTKRINGLSAEIEDSRPGGAGKLKAPDRKKAEELIKSFLDLWKAGTEISKFPNMYAALGNEYHNKWSFDSFKDFVSKNELQDYSTCFPLQSKSGTNGNAEYRTKVHLRFPDNVCIWPFYLLAEKAALAFALTPYSTPPANMHHTNVNQIQHRQSGIDTGHHHMVYSVSLENMSDDTLIDAYAHVFCGDVCGGSFSLGELVPHKSLEIEIMWENACLPIGQDLPAMSRYLIGGDEFGQNITYIRITYTINCKKSGLWSEDFPEKTSSGFSETRRQDESPLHSHQRLSSAIGRDSSTSNEAGL